MQRRAFIARSFILTASALSPLAVCPAEGKRLILKDQSN